RAIQSLGESSLDDVIALVSGAATAAQSLPAGSGEGPSMPESSARSLTPPPPASGSDAQVTQEVSQVALPERDAGTGTVFPKEASQAPPGTQTSNALSGMELWSAAQKRLIEERPLFETWLVAAQFLSHEGPRFVIGFSAEQRFFRESLSRYEKEIAETISQFAGSSVELVVEVRDDLVPTEVIEEASPEAPVEEVSAPAEDKAEEESSEPPLDEPEEEDSGEDFRKDPLISEALEVFQARVIKS
ncbi:MAG: hypothetical protein AAF491_08220, partial [Verrucomicrobiota bacterium]